MTELLQAAKAVIEKWDLIKPDQVPAYIKELHAAVEQAEKQEAVGFREWWDEHVGYGEPHRLANDRRVWTAAQQAERERCREIVITMGGPDVPDLLRQIDSGEE